MCQREWKGGERKMRKCEMRHNVTEKSTSSGRKKQAGKRLSYRQAKTLHTTRGEFLNAELLPTNINRVIITNLVRSRGSS